MHQTIHIFRKDVRHHWPEIVVSLALVAVYGWKQARFGLEPSLMTDPRTAFLGMVLALVTPLVVISWALLVLRAVHEESLVGDRQFWVTRPYEWRSLLAAKVIFVVAFVNVPLLVLQVFLLQDAGFSPASHLEGLLWLQLMWTLVLILPVATLAAITASVGRSLLVVLGVLLYAVAVGILASALPNAGVSPGTFPVPQLVRALAALGVVVVVWQYARRRTAQARIALLIAAAVIPLVLVVTPYRALIARAYPGAPAGFPVALRLDPAGLSSRKGGYPERNKVHLRIPLLVSGIPIGSVVFVHGMLVNIQAPDGTRWSSEWQSTYLSLEADHPSASLPITLDRGFFERVKSAPARVEIGLALHWLRARETQTITAAPGRIRSSRCWAVRRVWRQHLLPVSARNTVSGDYRPVGGYDLSCA